MHKANDFFLFIEIQKLSWCVCISKQFKIIMKKQLKTIVILFATVLFATASYAQSNPKVGGETMYPTKDIVSNAVNSKDHTTLVAAVKAADLVATLQSKGPFTVFAPVNAAFDKLPDGTVATLLKKENKAQLTAVLTYHVVAGKWSAKAIMKAIKKGGGKAVIKTVQGGELVAMMNGDMNVVVIDSKGNTANISTYDVNQSNGVIHVIDAVLLP